MKSIFTVLVVFCCSFQMAHGSSDEDLFGIVETQPVSRALIDPVAEEGSFQNGDHADVVITFGDERSCTSRFCNAMLGPSWCYSPQELDELRERQRQEGVSCFNRPMSCCEVVLVSVFAGSGLVISIVGAILSISVLAGGA